MILAVPKDTPIVTQTPTPAGALLVRAADGTLVEDTPTAADPYAHYCVECGVGPAGQKTLILEYRSANGKVFTGYFYVTGFAELQLGVGPDALVYKLDSVLGTATIDPSATAQSPPAGFPPELCR